MYRPIDPTGLDFKIGLPYEEQYKAPRIVMMKSFDQQEYIQNFKGDLSILQLTATNPTGKSPLCTIMYCNYCHNCACGHFFIHLIKLDL